MSSSSGGARRLEPGAQVVFDGRTWQVGALVGATVRLVDEKGVTASVLATVLLADPGFEVVGVPRAGAPQWGLFQSVPLPAQERALAWQRHIREVETGLPGAPGDGGVPRPQYDPARWTLAQREQAEADELAGLGWTRVSRATVQKMRLDYRKQGLWGVVDKRSMRQTAGRGRGDERVAAAVLEALRLRRGRPKTSIRQIIELTEQILTRTHGPGQVKLPARSSLYRLVNALADPLARPGSPARTATATRRGPAPEPVLRPGERVQIATAGLEVTAVGDDGRAVAVEVTIALDLATRSLLAAGLCAQGGGPVDPGVLLAEMAVPHPVRATWPTALQMAHASVPYERLLAVDARLEAAAARPVMVPETLVVDGAGTTGSGAFMAACQTLGVSVQAAPPRRPGAKGAAERTLAALNTLFARHIAGPPGATGPRGHGGVHQALWSVPQLQDLLDEWITACWQNRSHEDLRHPAISGAALSPNEMWGALVAWCGYVPLPLTGADYPELLPARWQAVTERGIRIGHRTYDHPCLDTHRGQPSPVASRGGKWEVHTHPHDLRQVWIRLPDGHLHAVPWIDRDHVQRPFDDAVRRQAGQAVEQRTARAQHQTDLADTTGQLLARARTGPATRSVALPDGGLAERPARATAAGHARRTARLRPGTLAGPVRAVTTKAAHRMPGGRHRHRLRPRRRSGTPARTTSTPSTTAACTADRERARACSRCTTLVWRPSSGERTRPRGRHRHDRTRRRRHSRRPGHRRGARGAWHASAPAGRAGCPGEVRGPHLGGGGRGGCHCAAGRAGRRHRVGAGLPPVRRSRLRVRRRRRAGPHAAVGAVRERACAGEGTGSGLAAAHPRSRDRPARRTRQRRDPQARVRPRHAPAGGPGTRQGRRTGLAGLAAGQCGHGAADAAPLPRAGPVGAGRPAQPAALQPHRPRGRAGGDRRAGSPAAPARPLEGDPDRAADRDRADPG
ncbi:putative transposase [Actinacidiphila reveromycinica]|uniref:Putative transposase n=1 Tax=Actinacidiphila reveromycinica TaxID=659352 RepID=A0A7U3UMG3_9ACTN|nr:putative transposase [Streptomyces sp. SN-593]